jgi:hypothetical protein
VGNGSLGYSKSICLGRNIHAKGILGGFYDFNLGNQGIALKNANSQNPIIKIC